MNFQSPRAAHRAQPSDSETRSLPSGRSSLFPLPNVFLGAVRLAALAVLLSVRLPAENPIIQTNFTADPAPLVHNGVLYLYTSHDEDTAPAGMGRFRMLDWKCYSTTDMVNWTDHGTIASLADFAWADQTNDAWAPQVVEREGKFYLYVPISVRGQPKNVIAVGVADNPLGPFKDPLGKPLIAAKTGYIDPTVFVDDDGQAYLYFGNPKLWYVKLNPDMITYSGEIVEVPSKPDNYQEGPWFYKRSGRYYLAYASTCCPEGIGYAMSEHPTGPWTYAGYVMKPNKASSGNHPGIVDYKGTSYVFGFHYKLNALLTSEHHERRSVCVAQLRYNADGTIPELPWWDDAGVAQVGTLDPFSRVQAETICWSENIRTRTFSPGKMGAYPTKAGAYIKVKGVDFKAGAKTFRISYSSSTSAPSARLELHLDSPQGLLLGTCTLDGIQGSPEWSVASTPVTGAAGIHDLFLVFPDDSATTRAFDWWQFD
jgi:arabinoxylan arabinofuranohydrolase